MPQGTLDRWRQRTGQEGDIWGESQEPRVGAVLDKKPFGENLQFAFDNLFKGVKQGKEKLESDILSAEENGNVELYEAYVRVYVCDFIFDSIVEVKSKDTWREIFTLFNDFCNQDKESQFNKALVVLETDARHVFIDVVEKLEMDCKSELPSWDV